MPSVSNHSLDAVVRLYGLDSIQYKLKSNGISLMVLRWLNMQSDFENLTQIMGLNATETIKLRAMITSLQSTRDDSNDSGDDNDNRCDIIHRIAVDLERDVSLRFDGWINQLEHRKIQLLTEIHEWKQREMNNEDEDTVPDVHFECNPFLNIEDISSFGGIQIGSTDDDTEELKEEENESLNHHHEVIGNHRWNPFCDDIINESVKEQEIEENSFNDLESNNLEHIQLEYVNHRGHFLEDDEDQKDLYHPRNILDLYNNKRYYSNKLSSFMMNGERLESDWIIFRTLYHDQFHVPKVLEIKNYHNEYALKKMFLWVGDGESEWIPFDFSPIETVIANDRFGVQRYQLDTSCEYSIIDDALMEERKLNYFKLDFFENWGANIADKARFCVDYVGICYEKSDATKELEREHIGVLL